MGVPLFVRQKNVGEQGQPTPWGYKILRMPPPRGHVGCLPPKHFRPQIRAAAGHRKDQAPSRLRLLALSMQLREGNLGGWKTSSTWRNKVLRLLATRESRKSSAPQTRWT